MGGIGICTKVIAKHERFRYICQFDFMVRLQFGHRSALLKVVWLTCATSVAKADGP
jgi:hypothetical protein